MLKIVSVTALSLALLPALSMASDAGTLKTGEKLYKSACIACHSTGDGQRAQARQQAGVGPADRPRAWTN